MEDNKRVIESLLYRMQKFDEKYVRLRGQVSGTVGSYIDLLLTKKGNLSRKSLNRLIEELLGCLGEYRSYKASLQKGFDAPMEPYHFTDKESAFYRSYLYLLLGLALRQNSGPTTRWCKPGTWGALIERAGFPVTYREMAELDRDLINAAELSPWVYPCPMRTPEGLFYDILCAYSTVVGESFSENISGAEREAACRLMTDEERYLLSNPREKERLAQEEEEEKEELMKEIIDELAKQLEGISPEEAYGETDDIDDADNRYVDYDNEEETDGWFWFFSTDKKRFVESCNMIRKQYCDSLAHGNLNDEIEAAVQLYLYKKGLSGWRDDDCFFTAYTYLSKALKTAEKQAGVS